MSLAGGVQEQVSLERVREFWDNRPCNIRHSPAPLGSRRYFDEVEARKYFVEPHIPRFADFARWEGKRVLEIGCGIGTDTINFARAGAVVTAIDLSPHSIDVARQRARVFGLEDCITFVECNAEDLSPVRPSAPFDLVYSFGVLHHTPIPAAALTQIREVIAESGILKVMMYHQRSWKVASILLRRGWEIPLRQITVGGLVARYSEAQTGCPVTYVYTPTTLAALLDEAGFSVETTVVDHIFPYRIPEYTHYEYRRTALFRLMPSHLFRWLEARYGWHLCVTARPKGAEAAPALPGRA